MKPYDEIKFKNADKCAIRHINKLLDSPYFNPTNLYINVQTLSKTIAIDGYIEKLKKIVNSKKNNIFFFFCCICNKKYAYFMLL